MEQKGVYNRTIVVISYLFLVGVVAYLVSSSDNLTLQMGKEFLMGAAFPVLGYVLIKGQNAPKQESTKEPIADE